MKVSKRLLKFSMVLILTLSSMSLVVTGCGGGGGGGGGSSDDGGGTPTTGPVALTSEDFSSDEGLTDGGVVTTATQTLRGTVPNPGGDGATSFQGKAYLSLNGIDIQLDVSSGTYTALSKTYYKDGVKIVSKSPSLDDPEFDFIQDKASGDWIFEVTFSINAGPNTMQIQVYDLDNSLFAATDTWTIVGAVEPTSMVVTLWWNTNQTDIDLHMSPDGGSTHCYYSNKTAGDMALDYDDTNGYGPEHVTITDATLSATYDIKVYYYADHNDADTTTPTTCYINAQVNGETVLDTSTTLSSASSSSGWQDGAHVWNAGSIDVTAANVLNVAIGTPDLSNWPTVTIPVTVTDPAYENAGVEDLTSDYIYLVNSGTFMDPLTVTGGENGEYVLSYQDITAGKRNVFVYVYAPFEAGGFEGGLSSTITYGTNYALFVGLNEYPASTYAIGSWYDAAGPVPHIKATISSTTKIPDSAADFTVTFTDTPGEGNGDRPAVTVSGSSMAGPGTANGLGEYDIAFPAPANYLDYDHASLKFKKASWLTNSVNDISDMRTALLTTATGAASTMWESANMYTLTNSAATEIAVLTYIEAIAELMQPYDLFLFHYSGHGADGTTDSNQYLCTYEDDAWTSVTDLSEKLALIPNQNVVNTIVLLDACFSGNFVDRGLADDAALSPVGALEKYRAFLPQAEASDGFGQRFTVNDMRGLTGNNLFVMTAVDGSHSAWDAGALSNGVFTYYLVEGINVSGKTVSAASANANHDKWVTGEEAYSYTQPKASAYVQTNILPTNPGSSQDAQIYPDTTGRTRLIYNW